MGCRMSDNRICAIIEARMSSSRFYGKVMKEFSGRTMIDIMTSRLKNSMLVDEVVVATTTNKNDDVLCGHLDKIGISYYRGSEENVLDRVLKTATRFGADIIVEATADCPLIDPHIVDQSIGYFLKTNSDYVGNTTITNAYPRGQDVQVFTTQTLDLVSKLTHHPDDLENVSLYIYNNRELFVCDGLPEPCFNFDREMRLTVDYEVDFEVVCAILGSLGFDCNFRDICDFMESNSDIAETNKNTGVEYINDKIRNGV